MSLCIKSFNSGQTLKNNVYLVPENGFTVKEDAAEILVPSAMSLRLLSAELRSKQPLGDNGLRFTVRVNGKNSDMHLNVTNGHIKAKNSKNLNIPAMSKVSIHVSTIGSPVLCSALVSYALH